ncbi:MAG: VOC family protein [Gemmataceae bacterium]
MHELFEIVLCVRDVDIAATFYRDAVGLEPINPPGDGWASFWVGPEEDNKWLGLRSGHLLFEEHSPRPEGQRFGPVHFALKLQANERDAALDRLKAFGITVLGPKEWLGGRFAGASFYFYDPDDNLVELWIPDA